MKNIIKAGVFLSVAAVSSTAMAANMQGISEGCRSTVGKFEASKGYSALAQGKAQNGDAYGCGYWGGEQFQKDADAKAIAECSKYAKGCKVTGRKSR